MEKELIPLRIMLFSTNLFRFSATLLSPPEAILISLLISSFISDSEYL